MQHVGGILSYSLISYWFAEFPKTDEVYGQLYSRWGC
jgi:hypothetical protein